MRERERERERARERRSFGLSLRGPIDKTVGYAALLTKQKCGMTWTAQACASAGMRATQAADEVLYLRRLPLLRAAAEVPGALEARQPQYNHHFSFSVRSQGF